MPERESSSFSMVSYLLTGFRARGQQELETEGNAVFVPYSITVAVAPPRFIKKRPCLLRVIGIGLYVLWIFRAVYVKSRSYYLPETQKNFSQESFPVDKMGHRPPYPLIPEKRLFQIPTYVVVARGRIGGLVEFFFETIPRSSALTTEAEEDPQDQAPVF